VGVWEKERLYIEALEASWTNRQEDAIAKWKQIVDLYPDDKEALWNLASDCSERGEYEESLKYYGEILDIDPYHKRTYNSLAYLYDQLGDFEKSIGAINRYIELAPDEANPYDTRADLYAYHGDIDSAIASYQRAVEIKPDYFASVVKLGNMYLYKGQYDRAEAQYRELLDSEDPSVRSRGRSYPAVVKWYQGKLQEALELLETAIAEDKKDRYYADQHMEKFSMRSAIYTDRKQFERALTEARIRFDIYKQIFPRYEAQMDLALAGACADNGDLSQAQSLITLYEPVLDTLSHYAQSLYYRAKGKIALRDDDPKGASAYWEQAGRLSPHDFATAHDLATAYLASDRVDKAIAVLKKALARYDENRLTFPYLAARAYYTLGCAYQAASKRDDAIEQFRLFLKITGNADPELDEVPDARKRLEQLRKSS
jgi:tetratricopeptide (TPR) repeat protein